MDSSPNSQNSQRSAVAGKLEKICSGVFNLLKPVELLLTECLTPLIEDSCTRASCSIIELMKTDFCLLDHLAAMRVGELETLILLIEGFHALTLIVLKLKGF
ncbi:uncharacterized protein LOC110068127, partial [Orbicella faveolata]|uniref:uncharacterized protein LOC110068127 n=1 Tax=Orbicella faveolata TaxID=48498 RepID=UPI0009E3FFFE